MSRPQETRILVVDDNPVNIKLAAALLSRAGYAVDQTGDAETALALIQASPPDLVLLDLQLPKMDGLELARLLKADERTRHVILVAFTAHAMKGDRERAAAAGCSGYLTKPIDTRVFARQVAAFLAPDTSGNNPSPP
jgi:CheY-like chemotaxis protein